MSKATDSALMKEAIADARALREISVENAKESLLERFTPKLKALVQDRMLEASEEEEEDEEEEEELEMDLDDQEDSDEEADEAEEDTDDDEEDEEMEESLEISESDLEEIAQYLTRQQEAVATDRRHSDTDVADRFSDRQPQHDNNRLLDLDGIGTGYDEESLDDVVLDEIRDALGIDEIISTLTEEEDKEETAMEEAIRRIFQEMEEDDYMDEGDDYMDEMEHEDSMDEGLTFDIDLNEYGVTSLTRDPMGDQVGRGGTYLELVDDLMDDADNYGAFDPEGAGAETTEEAATDPLEEEIDLSGVLYEMEEEEEEEMEMEEMSLRRQNRKLREKLGKYRKAVGILRDQIRESKMVTKKLQYTNKLFNNLNLNGKQRTRVIENFDRAETEREIELTYKSLAENLTDKAGHKGSLTESFQRNSAGAASGRQESTKPKTRIINESTSLKDRFQELAGIL